MYKILANTLFLGKNLIFTPECHSTNSLALSLLKSRPVEGTLVITHHQTAGRGQRGNTWEAARGQNLTFSVVLNPSFLSIQDQFLLTITVSLALLDFLSGRINARIKIKWPNDIMANEKKIAGILIENSVLGEKVQHSVVGIGVNVNQTAFSNKMATSMSLHSQEVFDLSNELNSLLERLESRYLQLRSGETAALRQMYLDHLYWKDEAHEFESGGTFFTGAITGVDEWGKIVVNSLGKKRTFDLKEIKFVK